MKLRKVVAPFVASALALSAMTISASAIDADTYMRDGDANYTVFVRADKEADPNWSADTENAIDNIYGVTYTFSVAQEDVDAGTWFGGKIGVNSNSNGWKEFCTWGNDAETIKVAIEDCKFDLTYLSETPVFAEADAYAQFWAQSYGGAITTESVKLLAADGSEIGAVAEEAAGEEAASAYTAELAHKEKASVKVVDDVTEIVAKITNTASGENGFEGMNDWCGQGVIVTLEDGTKTGYQFGGAAVNWNCDIDGDGTDDAMGGVDGEAWLGTYADDAVEITIPVAKNAIVDIYCLSWDSYDGVQMTVAIDGGVEAYVAEEKAEEETAEEEKTEEEATEEETTEDEAAAEIDWDSYDEDAMVEANEAFTLGGAIDIYAVVGDAWEDIAKVEADFVWTPGLGGWCGGAGIGNGAVAADGSTWISGPEYGAANANAKYEPDGKATQVLVDLSENPLTAIASVNEDGTTSFGHIQIQNWWNGVEANAQVAAIRFLDADGEVLGELEYEVEVPEAPEAEEEETTDEETAPEAGDVSGETDSSKGSPDTGIEDVAVVAGLAIVAGGAVLVSKKRK